MKKILLDTNAYTHYLRGDEHILTTLDKAETVYFSIFVLGELYAGFKGGNKEKQNLQLLEKFLEKSKVTILDASEETAEIFGGIKDALKKAGTPIPINDVWIASHAIETGAVLISYDAHFTKVQGVRLFNSKFS